MRASASGLTTSEQVGEVTSRIAIMTPLDNIETFGRRAPTCRRTRPTSVLALRLKVPALRLPGEPPNRLADLVVAGHHHAFHGNAKAVALPSP